MLVPFTGWRCLNCGECTDRGFPRRSCCATPVPVRVLVDLPTVNAQQRDALNEARRGQIEEVQSS
jgi:hypothetical protein